MNDREENDREKIVISYYSFFNSHLKVDPKGTASHAVGCLCGPTSVNARINHSDR